MKPPALIPECPRGHPYGTSPHRRRVVGGLVLAAAPLLICAPFLIAATWSVMIADESIGPLITFGVWIVMFVLRVARANGGVTFVEWFAVVGSIVMLQLLLDLRMQYLGDVVVAVLHVVLGLVLAVAHWRERRRRRS